MFVYLGENINLLSVVLDNEPLQPAKSNERSRSLVVGAVGIIIGSDLVSSSPMTTEPVRITHIAKHPP